MADNFIQVAPDSTGKMMQTYMNMIGSNQVHAEVISLADKTGTNLGTTGDALNVAITNAINLNVTTAPAANASFNLSQVGGTTTNTAGQSGTLAIGGSLTNGSNVANATNPILISGSDYGGPAKIQTAKIDSAGSQYMSIVGTPTIVQSNASNLLATVSGTVTAIQSNASNLLVTASQGGTWNIGSINSTVNIATSGAITVAQSNASNLAATVNIASAQTVQTKEIPDATLTYCPSSATTAAYQSNLVVKGSAGVLFFLSGHNSKSSGQFIQVHNFGSLPSDNAVPTIIFWVPAQTSFSLDFGGKFGRYFSNGITICNSSNGAFKTLGAADCWFDAQYS